MPFYSNNIAQTFYVLTIDCYPFGRIVDEDLGGQVSNRVGHVEFVELHWLLLLEATPQVLVVLTAYKLNFEGVV